MTADSKKKYHKRWLRYGSVEQGNNKISI